MSIYLVMNLQPFFLQSQWGHTFSPWHLTDDVKSRDLQKATSKLWMDVKISVRPTVPCHNTFNGARRDCCQLQTSLRSRSSGLPFRVMMW